MRTAQPDLDQVATVDFTRGGGTREPRGATHASSRWMHGIAVSGSLAPVHEPPQDVILTFAEGSRRALGAGGSSDASRRELFLVIWAALLA